MNLSTDVRRRIYEIVVALVPLLMAYGVVDGSTAGLWVAVIAAALGLGSAGLARVNTPKTSGKHAAENFVPEAPAEED